MYITKRVLIFAVICAAIPAFVFGQSSSRTAYAGQELSVEQSYLQESVELMIIREQSRTESRDMKFVALEYINDAIDRGNKSDDIRAALEYLSLEGVVNVTRENGRVINNYPDVRRQAATYLGKLGTPEAKTTLIRMVNADNEPMVITEAIRSLGVMANDDNGEVSRNIVITLNRFHNLNPDNFMALSAIEAFEKIAEANRGIRDRNVLEILIKIADGPYVPVVQNRARALLNDLRNYE